MLVGVVIIYLVYTDIIAMGDILNGHSLSLLK